MTRRTSGESARFKARRYLLEGRVVIDHASPGLVEAVVRGDGALHQVTYRDSRWACTCPRDEPGACSHVLALRLVTAPHRPSSGGGSR
jgi:uncharacterized Zn finger protein